MSLKNKIVKHFNGKTSLTVRLWKNLMQNDWNEKNFSERHLTQAIVKSY